MQKYKRNIWREFCPVIIFSNLKKKIHTKPTPKERAAPPKLSTLIIDPVSPPLYEPHPSIAYYTYEIVTPLKIGLYNGTHQLLPKLTPIQVSLIFLCGYIPVKGLSYNLLLAVHSEFIPWLRPIHNHNTSNVIHCGHFEHIFNTDYIYKMHT